jgi:hypothetical protein
MPKRDERGFGATALAPGAKRFAVELDGFFAAALEGQVRLNNTVIILCVHIFITVLVLAFQAYNERGRVFRTSFFWVQSWGSRFRSIYATP